METLLTYEAKRRFLGGIVQDPAQPLVARLKALHLDNLPAGQNSLAKGTHLFRERAAIAPQNLSV